MPDFLTCDDPWFRPVQVKLGPDGALYIADFYNPIIGHYEVPLTDPRRDHTHGRIWRVVWKGGAPAMADLTKLDAAALVGKLADPNLVVRTLATNEASARLQDAARSAGLAEALQQSLKAGEDTARSHAFWALARQADAPQPTKNLANQLSSASAPVALAVAKYLRSSGPMDDALAAAVASNLAARRDDAHLQRALAEFVAEHPTETGLSLLVKALGADKADTEDVELKYARQVGVRDALKAPEGFRWASKLATTDKSAALLADIALAVPTAASAEFLLDHLQRTNFQAPRAGEYLRHIAQQLPAEKVGQLIGLVQRLGDVPEAQKLALADGLMQASRERGLKLPDAITEWTQTSMVAAFASTDPAVIDRAIAAVRSSALPAKAAPLQKIVAKAGEHGPRRAAALEALMNLPVATDAAVQALADPSSMTLRKKAAELLGSQRDPKASAALIAALPTAPGELAISIAAALAKNDATCRQLLDLVEQGKASPTLLRHNLVAAPLGARAEPLKVRAGALTKDLPPEDARLDGVIAQRVEAFRAAQPNAEHGAQVFAQNCVVCHRFKNNGGNVGPNLDGIASRGVHRLIEDVLDPNRNVDPGFRQTIVETKDGRTLVGANAREQDGTLLLTDAAGKELSVAKAEIKAQSQSRLSLMPAGFESQIPAGGFHRPRRLSPPVNSVTKRLSRPGRRGVQKDRARGRQPSRLSRQTRFQHIGPARRLVCPDRRNGCLPTC